MEWLRLAPDLEPGSFLRAEDGSNILDPTGQCVVFVKEGWVGTCNDHPWSFVHAAGRAFAWG